VPYLRNKGQQVTVPASREQAAARIGCAGRSGSLTRRKRRNAAGLWMRSGQRQPVTRMSVFSQRELAETVQVFSIPLGFMQCQVSGVVDFRRCDQR